MRKVVFGINSTVDGFNSHTDGVVDAELHNYHTELLRQADTIFFGRTTFELMVPYWPDLAVSQAGDPSSNEFARVFDQLKIVLVSTTLRQVSNPNTRIISGNLVEEVRSQKQQPGKNIEIGSLSLASQLSAAGLIDEYHSVIHPVIAGKGPRLFQRLEMERSARLDLIATKTFASGAVALHYRWRL